MRYSKQRELVLQKVEQQYLPDAIKDVKYYTFGDNKNEQAARAYWAKIKGEENV